jgi:hypothetical protein
MQCMQPILRQLAPLSGDALGSVLELIFLADDL